MAGKPYGIREMKVIVDYLVEHKAFGEVRGRKRWLDLANSQMTSRTWQSLKETFLKRILPDIHNPYYKLTKTQIRSFREARDVAAEENNKLEIVTIDNPNSIDVNQEQGEPTDTNDKENQEEPTAGEKCSKIPPNSRCSVDTLVLEHEDNDSGSTEENPIPIRDRIIYTEPLTPMLQAVLEDFNTDDEEGQLKIDENPKNSDLDTEPKTSEAGTNVEAETPKDNDEPKTNTANDSYQVKKNTDLNNIEMPKVNGDTESRPSLEGVHSQTQKTNNSTDSTIPNNQEVLVQNESNNYANKFTETQQSEATKNVDVRTRKRTPSVASNHSINKPTNSQTSEKLENPCLKSVSLFAEQFSTPNVIDSDSSLEANEQIPQKKEKDMPKIKINQTKEVVLLKSHSDTDSEPTAKISKTINKTQTISKTRSKAMANVFGFSGGGAHGKHTGKKLHHKKMQDIIISDSEWTSESDSEFVSPPRARRNRQTKKYVKPSSARIHSLEEEGGLFVVHGRKIYPLVKDGKIIKNYVTYFEEPDDEDEEESYWKRKYAQEKIKTAELSKLLENKSVAPPKPQTSNSKEKYKRQSAKKPKYDSEISENEESVGGDNDNAVVKSKEAVPPPDKSIKIKFSENQKEVQLEGHWTQIRPVLQQVVNIFQKDTENEAQVNKNPPAQNMTAEGKPTEVPIIIENDVAEVAKRDINELEASIFKEIEQKDKEESANNVNSTNRRTRVRPPKIQDEQPSLAKIPKLEEEKPDVLSKHSTPRRKTISAIETTHNSPQTRKSERADSEEILYKFPSPSPMEHNTNTKLSTRRKSKPRNLRYNEKNNVHPFSPENTSVQSESTQGYQDSDISPISRRHKKRRKHSFSSLKNLPSKYRVKRFIRRRSHPHLLIEASSDSSNTSFNTSLKTTVFKNSSLGSDAYKSESYQLLLPKARPFKLLESIDENKPVNINIADQDNSVTLSTKSHNTIIITVNNDERNSSNVSLPVSPELSIVEKISVNKSLLSSDIDFPTLNEIKNNETKVGTNNKYLLSEIDASIPLMQQDCSFYGQKNKAKHERSKIKPNSDSLIDARKPVEINSPAQGLHAKLRNLILNSAKKIVDMSVDTSRKDEPMEVDNSNTERKKTRRKRSSTPQKKGKSQITKKNNNSPVMEERVEFCSNGGRHSCPPSVLAPIENVNLKPNVAPDSETIKTKANRRKKDIIKVKILRPKSKTPKKSKSKQPEDTTSTVSTATSLGTNESGIFVNTANDTIDLIHNHSETCLHAHDCIDSSIEILPANKSHISVHSHSNTIDEFLNEDLADFNIPEMYSNNAQDASDFKQLSSQESECQFTTNVLHVSDLSIFTEDLSDELPSPQGKSSKWYLLSEDETTNTNLPPLRGGLTANLNQIFPIVCAVPDLSTITEISKDADSRKQTSEFDIDDLKPPSGFITN